MSMSLRKGTLLTSLQENTETGENFDFVALLTRKRKVMEKDSVGPSVCFDDCASRMEVACEHTGLTCGHNRVCVPWPQLAS